MNGIYIESEKLLSRPDCVTWLDRCGAKWASGALFSDGGKTDKYIIFSGSYHNEFTTSDSSSDSYNHIPDPEQFCREVAKRLGIEEPKFGVDDQIADEQDESFYLGKPDKLYPHKIYRILDSLDGIPLDTRIPLSEWIPPFDVEVAFIGNKNFFGKFKYIDSETIIVVQSETGKNISVKDGHWMRIV